MSISFSRANLEQHMSEATAQVLETMFFTSAEPGGEDLAESGPPTEGAGKAERIGMELEFSGASKGRLGLSLDRRAAEELAMSFFGEFTSGCKREDSRSVMGELANMVCGAMLSHLDRHAIFCLGSPEELPEGIEPAGEILQTLRVEHGLLRLAFSLSEEQSPRSPEVADKR